MATTTTNLGLKKPEQTDFYDVSIFNENMDAIDEEFEKRKIKTATATEVGGIIAEPVSGTGYTKEAKIGEDGKIYVPDPLTTQWIQKVKSVTKSSGTTDITSLETPEGKYMSTEYAVGYYRIDLISTGEEAGAVGSYFANITSSDIYVSPIMEGTSDYAPILNIRNYNTNKYKLNLKLKNSTTSKIVYALITKIN